MKKSGLRTASRQLKVVLYNNPGGSLNTQGKQTAGQLEG